MSKSNDLSVLRHSAAHLLAHAIVELYPNTQLTIGPATKTGFFYDFLPAKNFKEEDLPLIEARMREIAKRDLPLTHEQMPKDKARELYKNNPFKLELINEIPGETVGIARQGDFFDLCRGGHVDSTGLIQHFSLETISGSYWRADKANQALQRIAGTAFFTAQDLQAHKQQHEDALQYDHRRLGKHLDLFSFHEEGVGFPFFHPKGSAVLQVMREYLRGILTKNNYQQLQTPIMLSDSLWKQSGHYAHYKDKMYFCQVEQDDIYAVRPMNCPGSIIVYKERPHSYRELPMRLAEFGLVHRYELSGVLHGLFRARAFTIDDAHIYCTPEQMEAEILATIQMTHMVLKKYNFDAIHVGVSTRPANSIGSDELWEKATNALTGALETAGITYELYEGEGAFYGPKIEFGIQDSMGRKWQCGTIQADFFMPENFDLSYIAPSGQKERPVMIHRAIYGSFERFFAILLEHYKGKLPFWLAPVQIRVLTITDAQKEYAKTVTEQLQTAGVRVEMDETSEQISSQIKSAQLQNIPWMVVLGQKELDNNTVTLRYLNGKQEFGLSHETLLAKVTQESQ